MIIYIYQGMMALGKGGPITGELRRGTQDGEAGVRSVKKKPGLNKCLSEGGTNRIFTNIFHFQGVSDDVSGCHNPISSLVFPPPILPTTMHFNASWLSLPHVSWTHTTLHPGVGGYWPICLWPQMPNLRNHCH